MLWPCRARSALIVTAWYFLFSTGGSFERYAGGQPDGNGPARPWPISRPVLSASNPAPRAREVGTHISLWLLGCFVSNGGVEGSQSE